LLSFFRVTDFAVNKPSSLGRNGTQNLSNRGPNARAILKFFGTLKNHQGTVNLLISRGLLNPFHYDNHGRAALPRRRSAQNSIDTRLNPICNHDMNNDRLQNWPPIVCKAETVHQLWCSTNYYEF
jgi:hypothetical protein